jgi:hypothetical protein
MNAESIQVGGDHYQHYAIQPIEFITRNNIPFCEGNIIKYLCRYKYKDGKKDLEKSLHYLKLIDQFDRYHNIMWSSNVIKVEEFVKQLDVIPAKIITAIVSRHRTPMSMNEVEGMIKGLINECDRQV